MSELWAKSAEINTNTSTYGNSYSDSATKQAKRKSRMRIIIIVVILLGAAVGFGACSEMKGGPGKALEAMVHMLPGAHDSKSTDSSDKTDDEGNGIAIEMEILMPGNG